MSQVDVQPAAPNAAALPLAVDLDLTLLLTDSLWEQFVALIFNRPRALFAALVALLHGPARFKARLSQLYALDPASLPYRQDFLHYLKQQKASGRSLHLVTAADMSIARSVAAHVGLFDTVEASDAGVNLKGRRKAERLLETFPDGFAYAGDADADLAVWAHARTIVLVGATPAVAGRARALGKPVVAECPSPKPRRRTWRKALRLHQWAKNILVFAPLILAHVYRNLHDDILCVAIFVAMGLVASSTYLINDLADLAADRIHHKKRSRPLASGALPITQGLVAVVALFAAGFGLGYAVSPLLAVGLGAYALLTLSYSFVLKRLALLDVVALGLLYTLRIVIGAVVIGVSLSVWLLTFSMFFFFSISLAKRYAEIFALGSRDASLSIAGRGYKTADGPAVLALGVSSSMASVLIIVLYLTQEAFPSGIYHHPNWLWAAPMILMIWASRVWLLAGRGELDEDPVAFAIRDRYSWVLAAPLVLSFGLAVLR